MVKYSTRQRKALSCFFCAHPDESFSAAEIADALESEGVSLSAVYRNLAALEADGIVCRVQKEQRREVLYRYTQADACQKHLHLTCSRCGKTFHMNIPATETLARQVAEDADFELDRSSTVLYGVCGNCLHGKESAS